MDWISDPQIWIALATLTFLEIVLGVDNIIFISILSGKLPRGAAAQGAAAGSAGRDGHARAAALLARLDHPADGARCSRWSAPNISGRDLILILGGLFLLAKSTHEIHDKLEGEEGHASGRVAASFTSVIIQIMLLDIVFSLDSVITAVGMVDELWVMVTAVIIAVGIMMWSAEPISAFVHRHPTVKMLALSFLLLIGLSLVAEGFGHHIPKGYIYFAMGFSVFVEFINLRLRRKSNPVQLHEAYVAAAEPASRATAKGTPDQAVALRSRHLRARFVTSARETCRGAEAS